VWVGSGEGAMPQKILRFLPENGAFWLHFFVIREIVSQFKGGGAWPKWPNGKYATGHTGTRAR